MKTSSKKVLRAGLVSSSLFAFSLLFGCINSPDNSSSEINGTSLRASGTLPATGGSETKVTVCHIPPGNPANAHTITVGSPAVDAHLKHGDKLGACEEVVPPPVNAD